MTFIAAEKHQSQIPALQLLVALGFQPLAPAQALALRGGRLRNVVLDDVLVDQLLKLNRFTHRGRDYPFDLADAHEASREVTAQDKALYALCRPDRLLDIVRRFTVFDGGVRKIARHQQFFGIRAAVERVRQREIDGRRKGGVIWHTQGSGKSLTMVMLGRGRALALDPGITSPRLLIVTDRDDLDKQIKATFKSCELEPVRATSGSHLLELIRDKTPLVTTIVNKFDTAMRSGELVVDDANIFVLVDESHRTQTGRHGGLSQFAMKMRRILPRACYLGFTGTPLLKRERNTLETFGGLIHKYAIDEAVADGAVVPLLYEGRMVEQEITGDALDNWFEKLCQGLTDQQQADLKRKYSRMEALAKGEIPGVTDERGVVDYGAQIIA